MRYLIAMLIVLATLVTGTAAMARGGQAADDCPADSKDQDCKGK
jgi:hypothetical protein